MRFGLVEVAHVSSLRSFTPHRYWQVSRLVHGQLLRNYAVQKDWSEQKVLGAPRLNSMIIALQEGQLIQNPVVFL